LRVLLEALCSRDIDEDMGEGADSIGISAEHHIGETHIVVSKTISCGAPSVDDISTYVVK